MPEIKNIKILTYLSCQLGPRKFSPTNFAHAYDLYKHFVLEVILKRLCLEHMVSNILKYREINQETAFFFYMQEIYFSLMGSICHFTSLVIYAFFYFILDK